MADYPEKLVEVVEDMASITDRSERTDMLIETADRFSEVKVPPTIATKPYDERHKAPACESEAYVWAVDQPDGTLKYYFDVLNPQGLSAMAMAVILGQSVNGAPLDEIQAISEEIVFDFFGKTISMGKGQGLMGIISMVKAAASQNK